MALDTTTSAPTGIPILWEASGARAGNQSPLPIGRIIFDATFPVAIKDAADQRQIIFTATLPRNFYHRLTSLEIQILGASIADFDDMEAAGRCLITENQATVHNFSIINLVLRDDPSRTAVRWTDSGVTNDFATWFGTMESDISRWLINAAQGVSIVQLQLMDVSADASAALSISWRLEADMFTVEQAAAAPANYQLPTV